MPGSDRSDNSKVSHNLDSFITIVIYDDQLKFWHNWEYIVGLCVITR